MDFETNQELLTKSQLARIVGIPKYVVGYLHDCGVLPIAKSSDKPGVPVLYYPEAIDVLKNHQYKGKYQDSQ